MGKYFGTDGFRGKAGVDLTAEHAFQVGRFLGWYYSRKHAEDSAVRSTPALPRKPSVPKYLPIRTISSFVF